MVDVRGALRLRSATPAAAGELLGASATDGTVGWQQLSFSNISTTGVPSSGLTVYVCRAALVPFPLNPSVYIDLEMAFTAIGSAGTYTFGSLPSGFPYPTIPRHMALGVGGSVSGSSPPRLLIPATSGGLQLILPAGCAAVGYTGIVPLTP